MLKKIEDASIREASMAKIALTIIEDFKAIV